MKKKYTTPAASVETFAANEYVALCWSLSCARGSDDPLGWGAAALSKDAINNKLSGYGISASYADAGVHESKSGTCGSASSHSIQASGTSVSSSISIVENNSQQGSLPGTVMKFIDNGDGIIDSGDLVFWYTSGSGNRYWYHYGYVKSEDSSRPLHS